MSGPNSIFDVALEDTITIEELGTDTVLPTRGFTTQVLESKGLWCDVLFSSGDKSMSTAITAASGPDQATQIAQGACVLELLDASGAYEPATLELGSLGYTVYVTTLRHERCGDGARRSRRWRDRPLLHHA